VFETALDVGIRCGSMRSWLTLSLAGCCRSEVDDNEVVMMKEEERWAK